MYSPYSQQYPCQKRPGKSLIFQCAIINLQMLFLTETTMDTTKPIILMSWLPSRVDISSITSLYHCYMSQTVTMKLALHRVYLHFSLFHPRSVATFKNLNDTERSSNRSERRS